jgi:hypothetical protein
MIDGDHERPVSVVRLGKQAELRSQNTIEHALELAEVLPIGTCQPIHDIVRECDRERSYTPDAAAELRHLPVCRQHTRTGVPGLHVLPGNFIEHGFGEGDKVEHHGSP